MEAGYVVGLECVFPSFLAKILQRGLKSSVHDTSEREKFCREEWENLPRSRCAKLVVTRARTPAIAAERPSTRVLGNGIEHSGSKREISTRSEPRVGGEIFFKKKIDVNIEKKKKKNLQNVFTWDRDNKACTMSTCLFYFKMRYSSVQSRSP